MSPTYWIFITLTILLLTFLSYGTFATARLLRHWQPDHNLLLLPAENLVRLAMIAFAIFLGRLSGLSGAQLGWAGSQLWRQLFVGLGWGIVLALFFFWTTRWLLHHGGERYYSAVIIQAIAPKNVRELIAVLLAMFPVVLLEELLFRSLLIGGFQLLFPTAALVIGWGIFFGALHSPQGIWGMIGAGFAGVVLGAIFVYTGSLIAPLVAHYVTNSVQVVQAMRLGYGNRNAGDPPAGDPPGASPNFHG